MVREGNGPSGTGKASGNIIPQERIRLLHIIGDLGSGGAQSMLCRLLGAIDSASFETAVISLTDIGETGQRIQARGVPVRALGLRRQMPDPLLLLRLMRWIKGFRPDILQTWMYHANLIGGMAAKAEGCPCIVWNLRHGQLDPDLNGRTTIWIAKLGAKLSGWLPSRIICASNATHLAHQTMGYEGSKMVVIPSGFDLEEFHPDEAARASLREGLGLGEEALLIGHAGRFHPEKGHEVLIRAAASVLHEHPEAHFLLAGKGIDGHNQQLTRWIGEAGLGQSFHLLGCRADMPRLLASLDILASPSSSEAFPNVVGEAMACGVPCAVTDTGDSAQIVGETGRVAAPDDPEALAQAIGELVDLGSEGRRSLGQAARERIRQKYALEQVVRQYKGLYRELAAGRSRANGTGAQG